MQPNTPRAMRVLGIDPGYDRCGVALVEKVQGVKETVLYSACIQTSPKDPFDLRIFTIGNEIENLIQTYSPTFIASESLFFNTNVTTAINVAGVRGVISFLARKFNLRHTEWSPPQVKIAVTGYGKSDKGQVIAMVDRLVVMPSLVAPTKKRKDDEYDAVAVALTALAHERF